MTEAILRLFGLQKKKQTSDFSRFFREASSGEKKRVFMDVARKASEDQRKIMDKVS